MRSFSSTVLLFSISLSCVLGSESRSVEVQSGQSVTLLCSNYTSNPSTISWYRAVRRSTLRRISGITSSSDVVSSPDKKFTVSSNSSHVFLKINSVNSSDTGLYFCGYDSSLGLVIKESTYLDVKEGVMDKSVLVLVLVLVLGGLVLFLILVVIGLALKIKKLQAHHQGLTEQPEAENSENLNYAAVNFTRKPRSTREKSQN
ncbi:uncharacterized protein LOC129409886, partial [Boleophthalmus pectinirostris]|uniref:uncharacterized protein LOC129409886 n=1 Tax=Boleophthalmus pectinirostris TaxID=150288 RepID=UPI00242A417C